MYSPKIKLKKELFQRIRSIQNRQAHYLNKQSLNSLYSSYNSAGEIISYSLVIDKPNNHATTHTALSCGNSINRASNANKPLL